MNYLSYFLDIKMMFKERLLRLMKENGIQTQYMLAKKLNIKPNIVNNWFTNKAKCPRDPYLERIAKFFNVSMSWLRYGEAQYKPTLHSQAQFLAEEIAQYGPEAVLKCRQLLKIFFSGETPLDIAIQETRQKRKHKAVKAV